MRFKKDFPQCAVVKLEQNYRLRTAALLLICVASLRFFATQLDAADHLVRQQRPRLLARRTQDPDVDQGSRVRHTPWVAWAAWARRWQLMRGRARARASREKVMLRECDDPRDEAAAVVEFVKSLCGNARTLRAKPSHSWAWTAPNGPLDWSDVAVLGRTALST
jgi:superfamily I DNA/RNA helicase